MTPRLPFVLAFAIALLCPLAAAQTGDVDVQVEAVSQGEPLDMVAPEQVVHVNANVSVPEDGAEHRAFLNVTLGDEVHQAPVAQAEQGQIETGTSFQAPSQEGDHELAWTVTVERSDGGDWTTEHVEEDTVSFTVQEPAPPDPEDVTVTVEPIVGGQPLSNVTPGEQVLVYANVSVPERDQTAWRAELNVSVDGDQVDDVRQQRSGAGTIELFTIVQAAQTEGDHELGWTVTVDYRDTARQGTDWEQVLEEEDSHAFSVASPTLPPGPGIPWLWILIVGAVLVGGGGAAYWWTQRDRQIRGHARSQAMQDLEGESFQESAAAEAEVHPQLKILEARAQDLRRMIELAQERYEAGDLTEHQYETIRERKEDELEEVQTEMDEYREA